MHCTYVQFAGEWHNLPNGYVCTSQAVTQFSLSSLPLSPSQSLASPTLCYYGLLLPQMLVIFLAFLVLNWLGLKFFVHNWPLTSLQYIWRAYIMWKSPFYSTLLHFQLTEQIVSSFKKCYAFKWKNMYPSFPTISVSSISIYTSVHIAGELILWCPDHNFVCTCFKVHSDVSVYFTD